VSWWSPRQLAQRLAERLDVEQVRSAREWLLRLLCRPPLMRYAEALADLLLGRLALRLGLAPEAGWAMWLWRLAVRPSRRPQQQAERREWLVPLIERLEAAIRSVKRRAARYLPDVDFDRLGARLEWLPRRLSGLRWLWLPVLLLGLWPMVLFVTSPFSLAGQGLLFLLTWTAALFIRQISGRLPVLVLICLSIMVTARYIWWRSVETLGLATPLESGFALLLYGAECYTWIILLFGYIQTSWPLQRKPAPLPADPADWPAVDVFIPTYNEPLSVVRPTVYAAMGMDWPQDKLNIYILDDGGREEYRRFAAELGVGYIARVEHKHAKAGNINHALTVTGGEYIAIFDCDHIPTRSFLQTSMGWFLRDPKCALVQTPHHFFSPDPFERNFDTFRRVPNEGGLFYGLVQDGNDLWNASFFCGSCAVIKRGPLEQVGGVAVETVTEDAHTALKLHRLGYTSAYMKVVQAAGLATESLADHIGQRIRWARGMAQIFRIDNPFLGKGLNFFQRLCYGNAMLHFFYGIPRLIFLTMPQLYLYFGIHVIDANAISLCFYVLPHIFHANIANSKMQGKHRHSFWSEVYESVLAWYIVLPTTLAFINPKYGKFNVTAKGGLIEKSYFDWVISKPYLVLMVVNLLGFVIGMLRLTVWHSSEAGTVTLNLVWTVGNLIMLGAAVGVASEARQVRLAHRVPMHLPAVLYLPDGRAIACLTEDYSTGGLGLRLDEEVALPVDSQAWVGLNRGDREFSFPTRVAMSKGGRLGLRFDGLNAEQEIKLIQCTFGRADAWMRWDDDKAEDRPLMALREVVLLGLRGYRFLWRHSVDVLFVWLFPHLAKREAD
jgi:cellulose synthase (UDP-forming)